MTKGPSKHKPSGGPGMERFKMPDLIVKMAMNHVEAENERIRATAVTMDGDARSGHSRTGTSEQTSRISTNGPESKHD